MTNDIAKDEVYVSLQSKLANHFIHFNRIWGNYGYKPEQIAKRKRTIEKHFDDLFIDMVGEEEKRLNEKRVELNAILEETHRLVKDLELAAKDDPTKTLLANETLTLMEEEEILYGIVSDLRERKEIRMRRYNDINKKVEDLSQVLGEIPFTIDFNGIPTDPQVDELNRHLHTLQQEERNRMDKYSKLVAKLKQHFVHLEKFPANHLERVIITGQPFSTPVPLSVSVMKEVADLESSLCTQIENNRVEAEALWQKIRDLWKRLKTDEEIIAAFEKTHRWTEVGAQSTSKRKSRPVVLVAKPSLITGLQAELNRLEEEKKQNIASFIKELRDELIQLWERCFTKEGHQYTMSLYMGDKFQDSDFSDDIYSEELLDKHEKEVEKWRLYAEEQKKLIDGVSKRQDMWTKWIGLDLKSDDPARLANRGGALLREEKERKTLEKQIPKLEKELKALSDKHGEKYGIKFLVNGEDIECLIEREWNEFHDEKEARKNARKKPGFDDGKSVLMTTMTVGGGSRKRPAQQTPSTVTKAGQTPKRGKMAMATPKSPYCPLGFVPRSAVKRVPSVHIYPLKDNTKPSGSKTVKTPAIASKPPKPPGKKYPGVAIVQKYRKSIGRNRLAIKKGNECEESDGTLTCGSLSSVDKTNGSFSPVLNVAGCDEHFDFAKVAEKISGSENSPEKTKEDREVETKNRLKKLSTLAAINNDRFLTPSARGPTKAASTASGRKPRKSLRLQNKEQVGIRSTVVTPGKEDIVSPVSTYSEFSKDLLGQSTLNSSVAAAALAASREPLSNLGGTTPTRNRNAQPRMTPAKSNVPYNNRF